MAIRSFITKHKTIKNIAYPLYVIFTTSQVLIEALIRNIPRQIGGLRIRKLYYGLIFKSIGAGGRIDEGIIFYGARRISCGSNVLWGRNMTVNGSGGLTMGNDVLIGPGCFIWTINHDYSVNNFRSEPKYLHKPVIIEDNVWIAANVKIVPGVTIGTGSVIAMGSVVTKDVPPNSMIGGNPAKVIKRLVDVNIIAVGKKNECQ